MEKTVICAYCDGSGEIIDGWDDYEPTMVYRACPVCDGRGRHVEQDEWTMAAVATGESLSTCDVQD